jgi:hypothetical protein
MRIERVLIGATAVFGAICSLGCASNTERHWGEAYAENNASMIADHEAGQAAEYRKGQEQPKSDEVPTSILIQSGAGS